VTELAQAVHNARRPEVYTAVGRVYADIQHEIDQRKPRCEVSGRCCRFDEYGHRLYVTTAELATFVTQLPRSGLAAEKPGVLQVYKPLTACQFQVDGLCGVHSIRPFGCRIYFCDPTADSWMQTTYERFHNRLKQIHAELGLDYHYIEWRQALALLGVTQVASGKADPA
jgi:Fe-S-cluster containining protein